MAMNTCKTLTLLCASIAWDSCASATCRKDNKHRKLMYIESVDSEYRSIIRVHFITLINSMLCVSRIDIRFVQLKSTHFSINFCPTFFHSHKTRLSIGPILILLMAWNAIPNKFITSITTTEHSIFNAFSFIWTCFSDRLLCKPN